MNRLTRDELLHRALDLVDSPSLDQRDRPGGANALIDPNSLSIGWLQDALDYFHRKFPWATTLASASLDFAAGIDTYALPLDFTLDLRDGWRITQTGNERRIRRRPLQWFVDQNPNATRQIPVAYVVLPPNVRCWPTPDKTYIAEFWYYKLPSVLGANDKPAFPDDWTLIEYVRLRGKEWTGELQAGAAMTFARAQVADLQRSGLGMEAENAVIPFDPTVFSLVPSNPWDWMGKTTS